MLSSKAIKIFREMQEFDRPAWKLKQDEEITDATILGELYKIVKSD